MLIDFDVVAIRLFAKQHLAEGTLNHPIFFLLHLWVGPLCSTLFLWLSVLLCICLALVTRGTYLDGKRRGGTYSCLSQLRNIEVLINIDSKIAQL